jgi:hypothetical protein
VGPQGEHWGAGDLRLSRDFAHHGRGLQRVLVAARRFSGEDFVTNL